MRNLGGRSVAAWTMLWAASAGAQVFDRPIQLADRGPIFYAGVTSDGHAEDARGAAVFKKTIALNLTDATIQQALDSIQAAAHLQIAYLGDRLPAGQLLTLQASKITVGAALTAILMDAGLDVQLSSSGSLMLTNRSALSIHVAKAAPAAIQSRDVHGHVTDAANGQSLTAVQVQIKGTTLGAITRDDGAFTITGVPTGLTTLVVRRIGYKQTEVPVAADADHIEIALQHDVLQLEQTVITGQATVVKKENVANAVSVVDASQLDQVQAPTVLSDLQGKVAGANIQSNGGAPGGGIQIQLRGVSSIIGTSDPLFVVDGVIVSDATIQPGMGTIAQNSSTPTSNEQNGTNRLSDLDPNDIQSIEVLKGASAAAIYGSQAANGVVVITTKQGHVGKPEIKIGQKFGFPQLSNKIGERVFTSDTAATDAFGSGASAYWAPGKFFDHEQELSGYQPLSYATNLSVSGGSETSQYYVSGLNEHDGGIMQNTYYDKQTANAKLNQSLGKKLDIQVGLTLLHTADGRGFTGNDNVGASEYAALAETPSFFNLQPNADGVYPNNPFGTSNALQTAALFRNEESINRGLGSFGATWHVQQSGSNALNIVGTAGADFFNAQNNVYSPPTLQYEIFYGNPGTTVLQMSNSLQTNLNLNAVDIFTPKSDAFTATTSLGVQQNTRALNEDLTLGKNLTGALQNINTGTIVNVGQTRQDVIDQGLFAQEEVLTLHDRLLLTAGLRADRSTDDADIAKFYYYPKGSVSYRVPGSWKFIDAAKLRFAIGESGNEPLYGQKYGELSACQYQGAPCATLVGTVASPNLQPERQLEVEGGFDLTLFDSTMTLGVTGYQKSISQLLLQRTLPGQSGYTTEYFNGGDLRTRGIEIEAAVAPVQRRSTQWTINLTFTKVGELVTSLPVPAFQPSGAGLSPAYGTGYIAQGVSPTGLWGECTNPTTLQVSLCDLGDENPDYRVGLANEISVHRFHIYMDWDWQKGSDVINVTQNEYDFENNFPDAAKQVVCPVIDGGSGAVESVSQCRGGGIASNLGVYMDDASFIKLRELQLSYSLPISWVRYLGRSFTSATIQLEGRNLVAFDHYPGLDPEVSFISGNVNVGRNIDVTVFPPSRMYWFGINLGL
jgi:TonB-dependent starch-binding outer membrane protein SusC